LIYVSTFEIRRNSFAIRAVKPWNCLLEDVVMASTIRGFEAKLDKFWKDQPVKNSTSEKVRRAPKSEP